MEVFEYEHAGGKVKMLLMRDRASGLTAVEHLQNYGGDGEPATWEPTSEDIVSCICRWLMVNPTPKWIISDPATYFTPQVILDFCGNAGIGVMTTPAEAHEMMGGEESTIRVIKAAITKLIKEEPDMAVSDLGKLAAHGHNQCINQSCFSPF